MIENTLPLHTDKVNVTQKTKLSFKEKYAYGLGAIGKDLNCGMIFTFCMVYFTDVLKLDAGFVGTMFFVAKFWDAINDFFMGMVVDNTHTRWGKFKPWLVIGTLVNTVFFILLFTNVGLQGPALYIYATVMYILWGMTYTIMDIPYWSMLPNLTNDPTEREKVSVIPRIFASIGGTVLIGGCGIAIMNFLGQGNAQAGYTRIAWVIAAVFILTTAITVFGTKDRGNTEKKEKTSFKEAVRAIVKNDQLLVVIVVILAFNMAIQVCNGSILYYFKYVCNQATLFGAFTLAGGFAEIGGLFLFPKLARTFSRKVVYIMAGVLPVVGLALLFIVSFVAPQNIVMTVLAGILFRLGSGLQLGSVTVILADVVDYGEYKFEKRNESVTFSCQTLLVKFSSALGALMTGWALKATGYVPDIAQSAQTLMGMRIVSLVLPMVFALISMVVYLRFFKLNGEFYSKVMNVLNSRKEASEQ